MHRWCYSLAPPLFPSSSMRRRHDRRSRPTSQVGHLRLPSPVTMRSELGLFRHVLGVIECAILAIFASGAAHPVHKLSHVHPVATCTLLVVVRSASSWRPHRQ